MWDKQNISNLKGLSFGVAIMSIHSCTGQWSDPNFGRMLASTIGPSSIRVPKIKKLLAMKVAPGFLARAEPNAHQFLCHDSFNG
jgi:hypothetical protein